MGSFYLINLILAIVAMSYDELQREAEEEAQRELEELEAIKEAEEAASFEFYCIPQFYVYMAMKKCSDFCMAIVKPTYNIKISYYLKSNYLDSTYCGRKLCDAL